MNRELEEIVATATKTRGGSGDCFPAAAACAEALVQRGWPGKVRVVHGLPTGQGFENLGRRYWHAWVEVVAHGVPTVIDISNDKRLVLPRDRYYEVGEVKLVFRYTLEQLRRLSTKHGTWGPWIRGWEEMGL